MRITEHPILGKLEKHPISITFNGNKYPAYKGESIAAALLANNVRILRHTEKQKQPRGIYCGIGHCYECRVTVNKTHHVRACITPVKDNMFIESESGERI
ncbi:(2Fe-2S)-binding protein [Ornithinibacillus sp. L9]|uniref:(2Fe-2S)-binding protein n=1 Tax=Ornithinibacillus caprae TaxID=2678566 RepID=A0A6N8FK54_9BACI|nr:(2Fe-2S)-binding protein [Ornithinibacillus caprae]MUK87678.1 (2Fe-2S)-binding protein [Ornithinibacillus caprae]